jgi:hypothetical protein
MLTTTNSIQGLIMANAMLCKPLEKVNAKNENSKIIIKNRGYYTAYIKKNIFNITCERDFSNLELDILYHVVFMDMKLSSINLGVSYRTLCRHVNIICDNYDSKSMINVAYKISKYIDFSQGGDHV